MRFWTTLARGEKSAAAGLAAGGLRTGGAPVVRHAGGTNPCLLPTVSGPDLSSGKREHIAPWRGPTDRGTRDRPARRSKVAKLVTHHQLRQSVRERLNGAALPLDGRAAGRASSDWDGMNKPHRGDRAWVRSWSPEQIARRLPLNLPEDRSMRISAEVIYWAFSVDSRDGLKRRLCWRLRGGRVKRGPRALTCHLVWAHVTEKTLFVNRPDEVAALKLPGLLKCQGGRDGLHSRPCRSAHGILPSE